MARKRQRGNGAGTVYPRRNQTGKVVGYRGSYVGDTADGPKRLYVSGRTKTEAEKALRKAMADRDGGLVLDTGGLRVGPYLDRWLSNIRGTVRQRTWERYEQLVRVHIKPALSSIKLGDLTRAHLKNLYGQKLESVSPRTVQYIH